MRIVGASICCARASMERPGRVKGSNALWPDPNAVRQCASSCADLGFRREELMSWCEQNTVD